MKRTKIVATISEKNCEPEFLRSLYDAGMNAVRINSAHASEAGARRIIDNTRAVSSDIAVILDTKGPEIRITAMAGENALRGIYLQKGARICVRGVQSGDEISDGRTLYVSYRDIVRDVPAGASILIDDGEVELKVVDRNDTELVCRAENHGVVMQRKSVNIPETAISLPSVSERDRRFIEWAAANDVDFIAHSFVRGREDVEAVQKILDEYRSDIKIISKIENRQGVDNIDEILEASYGVMVARGDLGVEIAAEHIPVIQRMIVSRAIAAKRPVIIATQMLHTMIHSPRPTRAEVSDIASAIYQRVDAVMLSGETASGEFPLEAVSTMSRVIGEIERDEEHFTPLVEINMVSVNHEITAQLARSAVKACLNLPIRAIVTETLSGRTGRYLSAFRGRQPVYAVCYRSSVVRQLALSYGVQAIKRECGADRNLLLADTLSGLESESLLQPHDLVAVVGGGFDARTGASFLEISRVEHLQRRSLLHGAAYEVPQL